MNDKKKKPGHFEIEAWGMLLFFAIMIAGLFIVVKGLPHYWKYKADKQRIQQEQLQQQPVGGSGQTK